MIENEKAYWIIGDLSKLDIWGHGNKIEQFYLGGSRFRYDSKNYYITFKHNTSRGLLEIENLITYEEYHLAKTCVTDVLTKYRTTFHVSDEHWDLDYYSFTKHDKIFTFARIECEMPENRQNPITTPDIILDTELYLIETEVRNIDIINTTDLFLTEYNKYFDKY